MVTEVAGQPFVHTNHCMDLETIEVEASRPYEHQESSVARLDAATGHRSDLDELFADPEIARRAATRHETATCGAVKIWPRSRRLEAVWGVPGDEPWETFQL